MLELCAIYHNSPACMCKQTWIVDDVNVSVQRFGRRVAVLLLLLVVNVPVLFLLVVRRLIGVSHLFSSVFSHLFSSSCRWVYGEMQSVVSGVWQVKCSYRRQVGRLVIIVVVKFAHQHPRQCVYLLKGQFLLGGRVTESVCHAEVMRGELSVGIPLIFYSFINELCARVCLGVGPPIFKQGVCER